MENLEYFFKHSVSESVQTNQLIKCTNHVKQRARTIVCGMFVINLI